MKSKFDKSIIRYFLKRRAFAVKEAMVNGKMITIRAVVQPSEMHDCIIEIYPLPENGEPMEDLNAMMTGEPWVFSFDLDFDECAHGAFFETIEKISKQSDCVQFSI